MPFDAPFQLGPFAVAPDGRLGLIDPGCAPRLLLDWRGCRIEARLDARGDLSVGDLSVCAAVGRVPSTAAGGEALRAAALAALRALPAALPAGWRAELSADHRVALLTATRVVMPTDVQALLTDITVFLLALGPYLDLLAELGIVKTCPG